MLKTYCVLLGISLALQDVRIMGELFGPSAASIGGLLILLFYLLIRKDIRAETLKLYIKEIFLVTLVISLILLPRQENVLFGEIVWVKIFKVALSMLLLLLCLKFGQIFFILYENGLTFLTISYLLTVYLGILMERIELFPNVDKSFFHFTVNFTQRPRGFATEPSTLGYSISIGIFLLALISFKNIFWRNIFLISICISGFIVTTSRGYIGSVAATIPIVFLLVLIKRAKWLNLRLTSMALTGFLLIQSIFIGLLLRSSIWESLSRKVSDVTREVWAQVSITSLLKAPFGAGFQGLITAAPMYLKDYVENNSHRFSESSLRELILTYSQLNDFAISPKTITSLFCIISGIFGFAFLFNIISKIVKFSIGNIAVQFWEIFGIILLLITLLNYAGGLTSFAGFFLIGIFLERYKLTERIKNVD